MILRQQCEAMGFWGVDGKAAPAGKLVRCPSVASEEGKHGHALCWVHLYAENNIFRAEPLQYENRRPGQPEVPELPPAPPGEDRYLEAESACD